MVLIGEYPHRHDIVIGRNGWPLLLARGVRRALPLAAISRMAFWWGRKHKAVELPNYTGLDRHQVPNELQPALWSPMSEQESDTDEDTTSEVDDRRMILPYVNTDTRIIPGFHGIEPKTVREGVVYVPAGIAIIAAGLALWFGAFIATFLLLALSLPLLGVGVHLNVMMSRAWYLTPDGVLKEYLSYRFLKQTLPWGHKETVRNTHNIRCIHDDGEDDH